MQNVIQHINRTKDKKTHDNFNRCRKSLWKNLASLHDKSTEQTRKRRTIPQHDKSYLGQTYCQHCTEWEEIGSISHKIRNKTRVSTPSTLVQCSSWIFSPSSKTREWNKSDTNKNGRIQIIPVFRWYDPGT
jgi:hypothetical protein